MFPHRLYCWGAFWWRKPVFVSGQPQAIKNESYLEVLVEIKLQILSKPVVKYTIYGHLVYSFCGALLESKVIAVSCRNYWILSHYWPSWSYLHCILMLIMMIGLLGLPNFSLISQEKVAFSPAPINGQSQLGSLSKISTVLKLVWMVELYRGRYIIKRYHILSFWADY